MVFFAFVFKIKIPDRYWRQAEAVWRISSITTGWKSLSSAESLLSEGLLHPLSSAHPSFPTTLRLAPAHFHTHFTNQDTRRQQTHCIGFCIMCQKKTKIITIKKMNVYPADNSSETIWQIDKFIDPPVGGWSCRLLRQRYLTKELSDGTAKKL